jgi:hypothetical protein
MIKESITPLYGKLDEFRDNTANYKNVVRFEL